MKLYTNEQIADIIMNEGIGYAVQDYLPHDKIEDKELAQLWLKAQTALEKINDKLQEYYY